MNGPQSASSAAIPLRVFPVHQDSSDPATRIPADGTGPRACDEEAHDVADLTSGAPGPRDLDSVLASLRGADSVLAFSEAAEPCTDAFDGPDGDAD
ncbi:hypothetical protein [Arthrobacter sp. USHLN218]|uniref:hypothetical protein n=1 Tax=Arthrobacter sp. USHLN218 TaxID=3081232 RepID=UPI00301A9FF5